MNPFFTDLGEKLRAASARQGAAIDAPRLDGPLAEELLELARAVAHGRERRFAPLATFLAGVAVERSLRQGRPASESAAADIVREVREAVEREADAG